MTSRIVSKSGMSAAEGLFHGMMIACTLGLWYPVYRARKHAADRTTVTVIDSGRNY